jgi:hypothetical protein
LPGQLLRPTPARAPFQLIEAVTEQPAIRLARGEPVEGGPQVTDEEIDPLSRVDRQGRSPPQESVGVIRVGQVAPRTAAFPTLPRARRRRTL